jgi:hypothetical protein
MSNKTNKSFECLHCKKIFSTNYNLKVHINSSCKILIKEGKQKTEDEIKKIKEDFEEYKLENAKILEEYKLENAKLKGELEVYKSYGEFHAQGVMDIAKQPKNTNTNNYKNNIVMFDLRDEENVKDIQSKLCNTFEEKHLMEGQKGVAKAVVQGVLKNEEGVNDKYLCSDYSRSIFKTKDKYGNIITDQKATILTNIVYNGIRNKVGDISKMCMDREKNTDKLVSISNNTLDIIKMTEDNSDFRKELMTSS